MLLYLVCTSQQVQCMFRLTYSDKAVFCALVLRRLLSPLLQRFFLRLNILIKRDKSVGVFLHITLSSSVTHHICSSARKIHTLPVLQANFRLKIFARVLLTAVQNCRTPSIHQLISELYKSFLYTAIQNSRVNCVAESDHK